jgi:L-arabinonolactonase
MDKAELVVGCRNYHGEGVFWNPADGRVWWTDIHGKHLWWHEPESGQSGSIAMDDRVCCFAPRTGGGFIVAFARSIAFYDPQRGATETFHSFEPDKPGTRLNDGRTDRQGRLVVGGMDEAGGSGGSSVLRVDADRSVATLFDGVGCANSTCFSPDGTRMYFADSFAGSIWAYDYDPATGTPANRRVLKDFGGEAGVPDGSCVDAEGAVWNAVWEGRCAVRIMPDGRVDRVIEVPALKPTCCAFGGRDLDTLFITTSRLAMSDEQLAAEPLSGSLYACKPGVRGVVDAPFAG